MNGHIYTCDGCGRTGAIDAVACWYECPVCRWLGEFPERRRPSVWITFNTLFGLPFTKIRPWVWDEYKHMDRDWALRQRRLELGGDPLTQWKRRRRLNRLLRRQAQV